MKRNVVREFPIFKQLIKASVILFPGKLSKFNSIIQRPCNPVNGTPGYLFCPKFIKEDR